MSVDNGPTQSNDGDSESQTYRMLAAMDHRDDYWNPIDEFPHCLKNFHPHCLAFWLMLSIGESPRPTKCPWVSSPSSWQWWARDSMATRMGLWRWWRRGMDKAVAYKNGKSWLWGKVQSNTVMSGGKVTRIEQGDNMGLFMGATSMWMCHLWWSLGMMDKWREGGFLNWGFQVGFIDENKVGQCPASWAEGANCMVFIGRAINRYCAAWIGDIYIYDHFNHMAQIIFL